MITESLWAGVTFAELRPEQQDDERGPWFCRNCGREMRVDWTGPDDEPEL
jgi:hypothetical protein